MPHGKSFPSVHQLTASDACRLLLPQPLPVAGLPAPVLLQVSLASDPSDPCMHTAREMEEDCMVFLTTVLHITNNAHGQKISLAQQFLFLLVWKTWMHCSNTASIKGEFPAEALPRSSTVARNFAAHTCWHFLQASIYCQSKLETDKHDHGIF